MATQTPAEFADAVLANDRQLRSQQIGAAEPVGRLVEGQVILDQHGPGRLVQPRCFEYPPAA